MHMCVHQESSSTLSPAVLGGWEDDRVHCSWIILVHKYGFNKYFHLVLTGVKHKASPFHPEAPIYTNVHSGAAGGHIL